MTANREKLKRKSKMLIRSVNQSSRVIKTLRRTLTASLISKPCPKIWIFKAKIYQMVYTLDVIPGQGWMISGPSFNWDGNFFLNIFICYLRAFTSVYSVTSSVVWRSIFSSLKLSKKILYCMYKTLHAFTSIYIFTSFYLLWCIGWGAFFQLIIKEIFLFCT